MDRTVLAAYGWADIPVPPIEQPGRSRPGRPCKGGGEGQMKLGGVDGDG
jgi:hypothetical protein